MNLPKAQNQEMEQKWAFLEHGGSCFCSLLPPVGMKREEQAFPGLLKKPDLPSCSEPGASHNLENRPSQLPLAFYLSTLPPGQILRMLNCSHLQTNNQNPRTGVKAFRVSCGSRLAGWSAVSCRCCLIFPLRFRCSPER